MIPCQSLADPRSAIDQIDELLAGLAAERAHDMRAASRFLAEAASPAGPAGCAEAQCRTAPCTAALTALERL